MPYAAFDPAPPRAGRKEWIGLAVIALPCMLYSMDLTVLNLAVPALSADLEPSSTQLLWILDIYGFLVAGSLITMGTLGDRIGRRRLLLIGAAAFGAASIVAAFSTSARRAREAPRQTERAPASEARPPRREAEPARPAPPAERGGGRAEGRSSGGGSRESGGSRPSNEGGRRHR